MNDFRVTIWLHTSMTKSEVSDAISQALPSASYMVEEQSNNPQRLPRHRIGLEKVEVRDNLL